MSDGPVARAKETLTVPSFNPAYTPVVVDSDTLNFRIGPWVGPVFTLQDADEEGKIETFAERLDGETPIDELLESFPREHREDIATVLLKLHENDIVFDRSDRDDDLWAHLSLRTRFRARDRERLASKRVLVIECDRMGTQVATDLADAGVGEVGLVSPRGVEPGPVPNREPVERIESASLEAAIEAADFVTYVADSPRPEFVSRVNEAAYETGTPWTSAQIHGLDGFVGPTVFPGETACYRCFRERTMANVANRESYARFLNQADDRGPRLPGFGRMVAGYLVMDLANVLAFGTGYTAGRVIHVDGLRLSVECNDVLKLPRCEVCGREPGDGLSQYLTVEDIVNASDWMGEVDP